MENCRKIIIEALFGFVWVIFMVNIWRRIAQKLRIIILFHFGLISFRIDFGKLRAPFILCISGSAVTLIPLRDHANKKLVSEIYERLLELCRSSVFRTFGLRTFGPLVHGPWVQWDPAPLAMAIYGTTNTVYGTTPD